MDSSFYLFTQISRIVCFRDNIIIVTGVNIALNNPAPLPQPSIPTHKSKYVWLLLSRVNGCVNGDGSV